MTAECLQSNHQGRRTLLVKGFPTGSDELQPGHIRGLTNFARESHPSTTQWHMFGLASRAGDQTQRGREFNLDLSWRRARVVENFLFRKHFETLRPNSSGIAIPTLNIEVHGVGTRMSDVEGTDRNDEHHRSVIFSNNMFTGEEIVVSGHPERRNLTDFHIKYCGSGGGGLLLSGNLSLFVIRDSDNYFQRYAYIGVQGGVGAPISFGEGVARGQGWVQFRTRRAYSLNSFSGMATLSEAGAQLGVGISVVELEFGNGKGSGGNPITLEVPTGAGFSFGASSGIVSGLIAVGEPEFGNGWRRF